MSPRSTLIHSQRVGQVFLDNLDIMTKLEWDVINYSVKLKFSATLPSYLSMCLQRSVGELDNVRGLAKELIQNDEWVTQKNAIDENVEKSTMKRRRRVEQHELLHLPTGHD